MINYKYLKFFFYSGSKEKTSSTNKECNICKQPVSPSEYLYPCTNIKCPIKVHGKCEEETRKNDRFVRNYRKCTYCRTCKECNVVMGTVHASCDLCGGAGHVPCIRRTPGQMRDQYNCRVCREKTEQRHDYTPSAATIAQQRTPAKSKVPIQTPTQEPVGARRLLFSDDR